MRAHAHDLRAEVVSDWDLEDGAEADRVVDAVARDWRTAGLRPADATLCAYAEKLTREPWAMTETDLDPLREHGFDDDGIHDAVQVIAYFNYINRVADALHVDLEDFVRAWGEGGSD